MMDKEAFRLEEIFKREGIKDPKYFPIIKEKIKEIVGFDSHKYTNTFLVRRLSVRLRANKTLSYEEYGKILESSINEKQLLKKELTIHVTNFFRDKSMWNAFMEELIPKIITNKKDKGNREIKIWSAGCSSGEEALSIAICLRETLGNEINNFKVKILATDLEQSIITKAKEANYLDIQFKEMPESYKEQYFESVQEGFFKPKKEIFDMIEFQVGDILQPKKFGPFDVIFCRNTVIYFNPETKYQLYVDLYHTLNEKGYLILGKTEMIIGNARDKFILRNSLERFYQK